ncbi:MAG: hypothetical protein ACLGQU_07330 [Acidobacteriota bacterium]
MRTLRTAPVPLLSAHFLLLVLAVALPAWATGPKIHSVTLGPARIVSYTPPQAIPAQTAPQAQIGSETQSIPETQASLSAGTLRIRPLNVDGLRREWTMGEVHDVTDRTFVIRRALRINDSLPSEPVHWTWQPGPWLMVDRLTGHITALHLPDFDPLLSDVRWFRDDAAYCGMSTTGKKGVVAIVAQLGARRPIVARLLAPWPQPSPAHPVSQPVCAPVIWQRSPMRATLQLNGGRPVTYDVVGTVSLIEENDNSEP